MTEFGGRTLVLWEPNFSSLAAAVVPLLAPGGAEPLAIVPSTLEPATSVVTGLRAALRDRDVRSRLVLPRPLAGLALRRRDAAWTRVDAEGSHLRMDSRLTNPYLLVALVDDAWRKGPFVLDLPARFLHPIDRVRLAAMPDRLRLLADIAAPVLPRLSLVTTPVDDGWLEIATPDPVAAELWALSLAERFLDQRLEMQGPWEDPTVQRATELELGARVPRELAIDFGEGARLSPAARELLRTSAMRLGMSPGDV